MARLDSLIYAVGDTPSWPGLPNAQDATIGLSAVAASSVIGSPSVATPPPYPAKVAAGLYVRADQVIDLARYNNNAPADHVFLTISWGTLNPANGSYNWQPVDDVLTALAPTNGKITLRIQAGNTAPGWVKTASGGGIDVYNTARGITANCPRWWTSAARTAWQNMINTAGARYDGNPRVAMVSADLVMAVYSEPYILGGDPASAIRLWNAGLQGAAQQTQAIYDNVADTVAAFPNTLVELCMHDTLQYTKADGIAYSWPVGRQLAYDVGLEFGGRVCFTDYGLGPPDTLAAHPSGGGGGPLTETDSYQWMKKRREGVGEWAAITGPVGFQYTMSGSTDYDTAAANAIALKGQLIETFSHVSATYDSADRARDDAALKALQF